MLRVNADTKFVDDFQSRGIDDPNIVGAAVGHVDPREVIGDYRD